MCFSSETTEAPGAMIVAPPSLGRASVFSMCFLEEVLDYDLPMDLGDNTDGVTLPGTDRRDGHDRHRSYPRCSPTRAPF